MNQDDQNLKSFVNGGLARKFQGVAKDIKELKKGKGSTTVQQRVRDNLGGFFYLFIKGLMTMYLFMDSVICCGYQGRQPTRGRRSGDLGGRGYNRPQEEVPSHETWHEDLLLLTWKKL
ncbi:hypothetical protein M9H77_03072 [Catharanthus roseus]|uniref:Uncharacterized protein n=1 Tax=Catharanthus roseus TaxID=4058 RepID=A0ACC0CA58_CATRO|nr:hypothetical protein M9H77_03072 [Catharanthus roseus]